MATVIVQRIRPFSETQAHTITGAVTGKLYTVDALGRSTVDATDVPRLITQGWLYATPSPAGSGNITTINFGAFPGSAYASTTIAAPSITNPSIPIHAFVVPVATADHSVDEHVIDPPLVSGYADGNGNIVIVGVPRPDQKNSPIPPDLMPYGAWSVGWELV
jgi:hypothetical protein